MPEHTQGRQLTHIHTVQVQRGDDLIDLPATTRRNLELVKTLRGEDAPTLFSLLDTCMTGMGSRLLKTWLLEPQRDRTEARRRLSATTALRGERRSGGTARGSALRGELKGVSDVERITAPHRACARCARASWWALGKTLQKAELLAHNAPAPEPYLAQIFQPPAAARRLHRPAAPRHCRGAAALVRDGGVIASGFDAELDELRAISEQLRRLPAGVGGPRSAPHRHPQPARAVQQGARLLHRGHAEPGGQGARSTTSAARR